MCAAPERRRQAPSQSQQHVQGLGNVFGSPWSGALYIIQFAACCEGYFRMYPAQLWNIVPARLYPLKVVTI